MSKKILFPFCFDSDFNRGYSWTMELAVRMNAKLFFFTAVPPDSKAEKGIMRNVYHSLLEARGNYLQYFNTSKNGTTLAKTERCIEKGDFTWSLLKFVKKTRFDVIVVDPRASHLTPDTLHDVVEFSNGVIVLPNEPENSPDRTPEVPPSEIEKKITEDFYNTLRQAETYKLPGNFFRALGRDQSLFNYLRRFFKGNHPAE